MRIIQQVSIRNFLLATTLPVLLFVGLMMLPVHALQAQTTPQVLFDEANEAYDQGKYREAIKTYHSILENAESGPVYLNLGLSYVQLDSLGKAKYYFMKAQRYPITENRAQEGISYVNSRFSRTSAVLPELPWEQYFNWMRYSIGVGWLYTVGLIILNLGIILVVFRWLSYRFQDVRGSALFVWGTAALGALILLHGVFVTYLDDRYHKAVMIHQEQSVHEKPNAESAVVSKAYEGYVFQVDFYQSETADNWYYVRMSNGLYGWIPKTDILIL